MTFRTQLLNLNWCPSSLLIATLDLLRLFCVECLIPQSPANLAAHFHITKPYTQRTVAVPPYLTPRRQGPMAPTPYYARDTPAFTGFQPEPAGRGTEGIIWTCLSTILLSSWSSYHGNACNPNKPFKEEAIMSYVLKFFLAFLFPEVAALLSLDNLNTALQLRKTIRQVGGAEFANFSLTQAFIFVKESVYQRPHTSEEMECISPEALVKLVSSGRLSFSGLPTDDELADKSKRDWTLKSLSIIQTLWFIASIIARLSRGYPVSLYEDITVANAFCGVVEFSCWLHCPQDIRLPFILKSGIPRAANGPSTTVDSEKPEGEATVEASLLVSEPATTESEASSAPQLPVLEDISMDRMSRELPSSEHPLVTQKTNKRRASFITQPAKLLKIPDMVKVVVFAVFSVLFAGIHIAAWNYGFLSVAEAWIWRGSSLALTVLGLCLPFSFLIKTTRTSLDAIRHRFVVITLVLYALVRTMMLGVALASFRKVPTRMYETPSWTQYWPHI
ncbi:hypothetical protein NEUTE1DRAFT_110126 [Neurospora tetrasperma FGSC 2508]|uniref:Uncharacterized protein n=1 Tax=Neurospora tetrasperma (strain FGSC 2508 / ATCC MYA-4615 / P0657) TaxID=510951 RepID=F8MMT3_NEUT8|nr:uncharacterized protein NEUTE1DRAFT_110126 [Neurospora tetrasperma FGSC 2508]EGO57957.1 hypothetical protein NEUTE1DRAFT_110126 [Neurospora tetrasperma FGSC 2508]EGZ71746.1 hypothetical protein NEUTE2DRAFT_138891 [Neurospora tetrasperma FGSC 2509]